MPERQQDRQPIVSVKDLWFRYENQDWALRGVNLDIFQTDFMAIIGQNGAGKTTLVKHFNGILTPERGTVRISGRDASEFSMEEMATQVGYCYQNPDHQIFNLTVKKELEFGLSNLEVPEDEIERRTAQVLGTVELEGLEEEYPFALSRGQRQKLAVGSILAMNPPIMIIDEPTTGMDWRGGEAMMSLIRDLHLSGRTVVMITHDMRIVSAYANRVVVMVEGEILADGPPKEIFVQTDILKRAFLESPQINRIARALSGYGIPEDCLSVSEVLDSFKKVHAGGQR